MRLVRFTLLWLVALALLAPAALAITHPNRIAFERDGDLYALRLGHHPVRLTNTAAHEHAPAWSPDRREVAFAVGRRAVGVLNLATGARHLIATLPDRFDEIGAVTWSPSGTSIDLSAMNNFRRNGKDRLNGTVWTVGPTGSGLDQIVTGQGLITGLGFMPDGTSVFESAEWPNGVTLWHPHAPLGVNQFLPDGSDLHPVTKTTASDLDVSPIAPRIVFRGWERTCHACGEIWRMSAFGRNAHVIALPPKGHYGLYEPRFSPTDRRIAVLASKGRTASLWIMRPDGSRLHQVLPNVSGLDW